MAKEKVTCLLYDSCLKPIDLSQLLWDKKISLTLFKQRRKPLRIQECTQGLAEVQVHLYNDVLQR